jgi:lipopolysaccharide transport system permease protein
VTLIRIGPRTASVSLRDLWAYRELLGLLAWRDIAVRYRQTALGILWALLQPLLMMALFTVVLGRLGRGGPSPGQYALLAFCGLVPWQLIAYAVTNSANSLVSAERLITKVYFPRLIIPLASVVAGAVDFLVAFALLLVLLGLGGVRPGLHAFGLPLVVLLVLLVALAVAVGLSALVVRYRDVRHTLPFLAQLGLLASPIGYPLSFLPESLRGWAALNPMTGVAEGFRWALLGQPCPATELLVAFLVSATGLLLGLAYFFRVERTLADVV